MAFPLRPLCTVALCMLLLPAVSAGAYEKYAGNPVGARTEAFEGSDAAMTETSLFVENDTIVGWYRTKSGQTSRIAYLWTRDPYDLDAHKRETDIPAGYAYPYAVRIDATTYDLFAVQLSSGALYRFRTTDRVHFSRLCGGPVLTGAKENPAVAYDAAQGTWDMLLEDNEGGRFRLRAYTSADGCAWTDHGYAIPGSNGNGWLVKEGPARYVALYGAFGGGAWRIAGASGPSPSDLTVGDPDLLGGITQGWEDTHLSDPDVVIVPEGSLQYFDHHVYLYYTGDQKRTGVAVSDMGVEEGIEVPAEPAAGEAWRGEGIAARMLGILRRLLGR